MTSSRKMALPRPEVSPQQVLPPYLANRRVSYFVPPKYITKLLIQFDVYMYRPSVPDLIVFQALL